LCSARAGRGGAGYEQASLSASVSTSRASSEGLEADAGQLPPKRQRVAAAAAAAAAAGDSAAWASVPASGGSADPAAPQGSDAPGHPATSCSYECAPICTTMFFTAALRASQGAVPGAGGGMGAGSPGAGVDAAIAAATAAGVAAAAEGAAAAAAAAAGAGASSSGAPGGGGAGFEATPDNKPYLCTGWDCFLVREPCMMCAMALLHSRIRRVIYCRPDALHGALGGRHRLHAQRSLNHHYRVYHMPLLAGGGPHCGGGGGDGGGSLHARA